MHILALRTLKAFWEKHPQAEMPLRQWYVVASSARWSRPQDIKDQFGGSVDFLADNRSVFDIGGNKYRLITYNAYAFWAYICEVRWHPCRIRQDRRRNGR